MIDVYIGDNMADRPLTLRNLITITPCPTGASTDIHGNILKEITKEEHDETLARVRRAFRSKK